MFVKNNIASSANAPRLNEYLQSSIRHDFLNKSDVEMNKLFCKTMIIKYIFINTLIKTGINYDITLYITAN